MAFDFGRNLVFGLKMETTYNTFVRPATLNGLVVMEGGISPNQEFMEEMSANSIAERKSTDVVPSVQNWTSTLKCKFPKEGFGQLLKNVYGSVTDTAVGASFSGTRHIFKSSNTTPTSVSLLYIMNNYEWNLAGGAVSSLKLGGEIGKPIMAEVNFLGGKFTAPTIGTSPTIPTTAASTNPFYHFNDITNITVSDTVYTPFSWELNIENAYADGLADSYEIQSTTAAANSRKQLERAGEPPIKFTLSFKKLLQSNTQSAKFITGTSGASIIELKGATGATDTSTGVNDYYFKLDMVYSLIKSYELTKSGDLWVETTNLEGYFNTATSDNQMIYKDKQTVS